MKTAGRTFYTHGIFPKQFNDFSVFFCSKFQSRWSLPA